MIAAAGVLLAVLAAASARWCWWRRPVDGVPVLMYHKFGDPPLGTRFKGIWSPADEFRRHLSYLKEHGYTTVTMTQLHDAESGRGAMPARPVLVTADDGYANNYQVAFPILRESGMKMNIFLIGQSIGGDSRWDAHRETARPLPMLTWEQIREMQDSGLVEFGSHTMRHKNLIEIPLEEARHEVVDSKRFLEEKLGRAVVGFAYPWGAGAEDAAIRGLVREAGYAYDYSTVKGITPRPWDPASGAIMRVEPVKGISLLDLHLLVTRGRTRITRRFWE